MSTWECARCHCLFERTGLEEVCPACLPIDEYEFSRIKEFLTLHPGASSNTVMNELNVSLKSIKRYLKEDRLEIVGDNKGFIRCELCGTPLNSGRFCDACYREGQAMRRNEAGLGLKGVYLNQALKQKKSTEKGIQYRERDDKKRY